jgi:hypothetical protein
MTKVLMDITPEEDKMIDSLKAFARTTTRTKVFKFCLQKTFEMFKEVK